MNFFNKIFKSNKSNEKVSLTKITRTETIEGFSIPGIILNMQYHFSNIQVYSDGLISAWEMLDLSMFKKKLDEKWVVTSIPNGKTISIFSLGHWEIEKGEWNYNKETFYLKVKNLIKELNPRLENLYDYKGNNSKIVGKVSVAKHFIPNPKPYYFEEPETILPKRENGEKFNIFYRNDDGNTYLVELSIYKNEHIELTNLPKKKSFQFSELKELINGKKVITELQIGERVTILGLGSFTIVSGEGVKISSKYNEFLDKLSELKGEENSIDKCRRIFEEYKTTPNRKLRKDLKEAYENVPEHQRIFVGDMDTKDYVVRLIIYGEKVKKEWEDTYGYEFPNYDIPTPIKE